MIMNIDLTGVYFIAVMFMLAAFFAFVAFVTGLLALVELRAHRRGAPMKRLWGLYCLAAVTFALVCAVAPQLIRLPRGTLKWLDEQHQFWWPVPIALWWLFARFLRWRHARVKAAEAKG